MKITEFLPIGSVVQLFNEKKKVIVIGITPTKLKEEKKIVIYDYVGVPYPEGYLGGNSALLFNHADIQTTVFNGYSDSERESCLQAFQKLFDATKAITDTYQTKEGIEN